MGKHSKNKQKLNKKQSSKENIKYKNNEDILEKTKKIKPHKHKKLKKIIFSFLSIIITIFIIIQVIQFLKWQSILKEMCKNQGSVILDENKNVITTLGREKMHENITQNDITNNLKNAYIAIEDERYYKHHGVDIKRTSSAIFSYIIHFGSSSFGGSTITQQYVKNLTGNDSNSINRKVGEWIKAFETEMCMSKDEILCSYLNIIYVGPNVYGVQMGSKFYFNKDAKDLSLEECAFLAGLNHSPNSYNPFTEKDNSERIKLRTETVLDKMLELKYISKEEYDEAYTNVENGLNFEKGDLSEYENSIYSYHTESIISDITAEISKKKNISETFATNYLNMAGLKIYSTENTDIQKKLETEFEKDKYILHSENDNDATSQAAMVVIDHKTGHVVRNCWFTW